MSSVSDDLSFYKDKHWTPSMQPNMRCFVAMEALGVSSMVHCYLGFLAPTPRLTDAMMYMMYNSAEWQLLNGASVFPLSTPQSIRNYTCSLTSDEKAQLSTLLTRLQATKCIVKMTLVRLNLEMDVHLNETEVHYHHENSPYYGGTLAASNVLPSPSDISVVITCPADERTISKSRGGKKVFICETKDTYAAMRPYFLQQAKNLRRACNILAFKREVKDQVYVDTDPITGFVLWPDTKWTTRKEAMKDTMLVNNYAVNGEVQGSLVVTEELQVQCDQIVKQEMELNRSPIMQKYLLNFYLLAICNVKGIASIRDLTEKHLPLLKNMKYSIEKMLKTTFGLDSKELSLHFDYPPSFFRLHLHVTVLHNMRMIDPFRCILLDDIVEQLELKGHLRDNTFRFFLYDNMPITKKYAKYQ